MTPDTVRVEREVRSGSPGQTGSAPVYTGCVDTELTLTWIMPGLSAFIGNPITVPASGRVGYRSCTRASDSARVGWVTGLPGAPGALPELSVLLAQAEAHLELALPDVATSPPRGGVQLVSVPVWFWVRNFRPVSATASIPGLSATITAVPVTTTVRTGDGDTLLCQGPGIPYDPGRSYRDQRSPCSHAYLDHGDVQVSVTVRWAVSWVASDGQSGVLPDQARTTTFGLTVQEGQAVTD